MSTGQSSGTPSTYYGQKTVTFQPGSSVSAPVSVNVTNGDVLLIKVDIRVPPGPGGAMGFQILYASQVVVPWGDATQYLILDNDSVEFGVDTEIGGAMQVQGYNTGFWPHSIYIRFEYIPIASVGNTSALPTLVSL